MVLTSAVLKQHERFVPQIIHAWLKNCMRFLQQIWSTYTFVKRRQGIKSTTISNLRTNRVCLNKMNVCNTVANKASSFPAIVTKSSDEMNPLCWSQKGIQTPHANDVLYGRGGGTNHRKYLQPQNDISSLYLELISGNSSTYPATFRNQFLRSRKQAISCACESQNCLLQQHDSSRKGISGSSNR